MSSSDNVPAIGNWLMPRNGNAPGMVVAVLPSGKQCILARRVPPDYRVIESVHNTSDLKGPMTGTRVAVSIPQGSGK